MKRIVVLEFIGSLEDGGAETIVKDYALLIDRNRFEIRILAIRPFPGTAISKVLNDNNICVEYIFPKWNIASKFLCRFLGNLIIPYKLRRILKNGVDIIHTHLGTLRYLDLLSGFLNRYRISLVYTCHSLPMRYFDGMNRRQYWVAKKLISKNGLVITALHRDMAKEIESIFNIQNVVVIKNGIDLTRFNQKRKIGDEKRKEMGIPPNAFVIGSNARFVDAKNHDFIIKIFGEINNRVKNSFLILIGTGPRENEIIKQINKMGLSSKVFLLKNRTDIPDLLQTMDVFVHVPFYEGLGIALVEAQAAGIRCIIADTVPEEAFLSELAIPLSLNEDAPIWADTILDKTILSCFPNRIEEYDIGVTIKKLENLFYDMRNTEQL